jgi:hypothetical protein
VGAKPKPSTRRAQEEKPGALTAHAPVGAGKTVQHAADDLADSGLLDLGFMLAGKPASIAGMTTRRRTNQSRQSPTPKRYDFPGGLVSPICGGRSDAFSFRFRQRRT